MKEKNNTGVVYILTNPSFPEYVKIGYADNLEKRLKELNRSECIPYAFRVFAIYEVGERLQDIKLHNMIDSINPNLRAIETFDGKKRKKEFYAMGADDAFAILEALATISGTRNRLHKMTPEGHEILDEQIAEEIEQKTKYTEEMFFERSSPDIKLLYDKFKSSVIAFGDVSVEPKKLYIAFKANSNFTDVEVQKNSLKIYVNMSKGTLNDPKGFAQDISQIGHWGNGDYRINLTIDSDFDYIIELVNQSYIENIK